jgi:hypothetical protein
LHFENKIKVIYIYFQGYMQGGFSWPWRARSTYLQDYNVVLNACGRYMEILA